MNTCERLAAYVSRASWEMISPEARGKLKQHLLDSVGCALGAIQSEPLKAIRNEQNTYGTNGPCSLIGGGFTTPERAAFYNGALVRYLDFSDTFIAPGEVCHPSDNLSGVLAAAEMAELNGREFLVALAVAYDVQCRLTASGVSIMRKGFENTVQLSISLAAGISRALNLSEEQTAHAIALCAAGSLGLGVVRTGEHTSQWIGLAPAAAAFQCVHNVLLAKSGITGPLHVFAGPMSLEDVLGKHFSVDWERESYDAILACSLKRYDAEFHAQPCIEAVLKLRQEHRIRPEDVRGIQVDIPKTSHGALAVGKSPDPKSVTTKEDAENNIHYLLAVALIDGDVLPEQVTAQRLQSPDVQALMKRVVSWVSLAYSRDYPQSLKCKVRIGLEDGQIFELEKDGYEGFFRRPMPVESLLAKFKRLAKDSVSDASLERLIESVAKIEDRPLSELLTALRELQAGDPAAAYSNQAFAS